MQDMISKILKMDEEARKIDATVENDIQNVEQEVKRYRETIKVKYLEHARQRIEKNKIQEQAVAQKRLELVVDTQQNVSKRFDEIYHDNFNAWVETIFNNIVGE